ncbi:serine/threonine-protein kinase [Gordonia rubripertincta]|uniref:non-specific serine/threonine protein kinase n=1 Tax=Gordonia rubripertincta TaxID=36822 RepID=A0ABT4N457_GORRU|nr:serine/threonine-protein kinase [Gordonia rubripertincta]MCZ4553186.1 serine/threonine-protein kinase [Gordonia rubripertincta]
MAMGVAIGSYIGGYQILELIGRGGMGEVYKAQHPRLPRADAIKLLNSTYGTDPDTRARFEREADLVAPLSHPNLVNVLDRGTHEGQLWIAMEFVSGTDAAQLLSGGPLHPRLAVRIVSQIADGLDYAHRKGLLHRDVKPGNILITPGADPMNPDAVKLTDFGIARMAQETDSSLTSVGMTVGTLRYSAPEQIGGEEIDHRADVYALGCSLYELLTATAPFDAPTSQGLMAAHMFNPPPNPAAANPAVPAAMAAVIAKAMAKKPADRFNSGRELADAAQEALKGGGAPNSTRAQQAFVPPPVIKPVPPQHSSPRTPVGAVTFPPKAAPQPGRGPSTPYQSNPYQSGPYQPGPVDQGYGTSRPAVPVGVRSSPSSPQMRSGQYQPYGGAGTPPPAGPGSAMSGAAGAGGSAPQVPWFKRVAVMAGPIIVLALVVGVVAGLLLSGGAGSALATPAPPTATVADASVDITWPEVDGASEYVLRQGESIIYVGSEPKFSQPMPLPGTYTYSVSARSGDRDESPYSEAGGEVNVAQRWHGLEQIAATFPEIVGPSPLSSDNYGREACFGGTGTVDAEIPKSGSVLCRDSGGDFTIRIRQYPSRQVRDDYLASLGLKTSSETTGQGASGVLYQSPSPTSDWAGTAILAFDDSDREVYDVSVAMENGKDADAKAQLDRLPL